MNKSIRLQESNTKRPSSVLANPQILDRILHWLAGFFQLTDEEQRDAGVYLGDSMVSEISVQHEVTTNTTQIINKEKT